MDASVFRTLYLEWMSHCTLTSNYLVKQRSVDNINLICLNVDMASQQRTEQTARWESESDACHGYLGMTMHGTRLLPCLPQDTRDDQSVFYISRRGLLFTVQPYTETTITTMTMSVNPNFWCNFSMNDISWTWLLTQMDSMKSRRVGLKSASFLMKSYRSV